MIRILIYMVLLSSWFNYAQQSKSPNYLKYQIGIGATEFINSVFSSDDNAYAVELRYKTNEKIAFRGGLSYLSDTSEDGFLEGGLKVGLDKSLRIFNKWEFYYGIDLLASYSNFKSSDRDLFKVAIAPLFGIMFHISDNFSLSTEPLFFVRYNYLVDNNTFEQDNTDEWFQAGLGKIGYLQLNFHF